MTKVKPTTKEQLVYYLCHNISLGTYDQRFLDNILRLNITANKPLTTNQSSLFDKIVERYSRQLAKQEIASADMKLLPWTLQPIDSSPKFTEAHIAIEDDRIAVRSPYKKEFVKEFKELDAPLAWNKETKVWSSDFSEKYLKNIMDCVEKHYNNVNYDNETQHIFETLVAYEDCKYWSPTLVSRNGNLFVYAINKSLNTALEKVEISTSPASLA